MASSILESQLRNSLPEGATAANTIVAWEPVWAIGTGEAATPADVATMHRFLKEALADRLGDGARDMRLLYGGSVNSANAGELLAIEDVDGMLVGGASLDADHFWRIVECGSAK